MKETHGIFPILHHRTLVLLKSETLHVKMISSVQSSKLWLYERASRTERNLPLISWTHRVNEGSTKNTPNKSKGARVLATVCMNAFLPRYAGGDRPPIDYLPWFVDYYIGRRELHVPFEL